MMPDWFPRVIVLVRVPPVCSAYWGAADWHRSTVVRVEPMRVTLGRLDFLPTTRRADGITLYSPVS